jgi:hypothetical protein
MTITFVHQERPDSVIDIKNCKVNSISKAGNTEENISAVNQSASKVKVEKMGDSEWKTISVTLHENEIEACRLAMEKAKVVWSCRDDAHAFHRVCRDFLVLNGSSDRYEFDTFETEMMQFGPQNTMSLFEWVFPGYEVLIVEKSAISNV